MQLVNDVAWMRGQLETYFNKVAPTLATAESVEAVDRKVTCHIDNHVSNRTLFATWAGSAIVLLIAVFTVIIGG